MRQAVNTGPMQRPPIVCRSNFVGSWYADQTPTTWKGIIYNRS